MTVNERNRQRWRWEREAWERRDGGGGGVVMVVNEINRVQRFRERERE